LSGASWLDPGEVSLPNTHSIVASNSKDKDVSFNRRRPASNIAFWHLIIGSPHAISPLGTRRDRARDRLVLEAKVRKLITLSLVSTAVLAGACGKSKAPSTTAMSEDLRRDIQLASASQSIRINPDEITPSSKPQVSTRPKAAPSGNKVIRSQRPTVRASARPVETAEVRAQAPQPEVMASAPAASSAPAPTESSTPDAPPMARPGQAPGSGYPGSGRTHGDGNGSSAGSAGGGIGNVLGGILGAVIRGGVVGDDDHCDPRPGRSRGGVYGRPGGMGGIGGIIAGGMGGMRIPFTTVNRPR
jgi:hypothetical protein